MHQAICSCLAIAGLMGNTEAQELYAKECEYVYWHTIHTCSPEHMDIVWNHVPERWHPPQERFVIQKNEKKGHPVKQTEPLAAGPQSVSQKPPAGDEQTEPFVSSQPHRSPLKLVPSQPLNSSWCPAHSTQPPPPAPASPESVSQTKKTMATFMPAVSVKKRRDTSSGQADDSSVVSGEQADESKGQKSMDITVAPAKEVETLGVQSRQESDDIPKMPTHEAMHVFFQQCKESGKALGDDWPKVVDQAVQIVPEEAFSILAPTNKLVRLGICICCQTEEDLTNLKITLPVRLLLNMNVSAYVRVFVLVKAEDGPALSWLTRLMSCPITTKNLIVMVTHCSDWTFSKGYNCIIAAAASRGATVANPTDFPKTALSHHAEF